MSRGRHRPVLLLLAAALWVAEPGVAEAGHPAGSGLDLTVEAGLVSLYLPEPLPVADVVATLAQAVGADFTVRRDPGSVGPLRLDAVPVSEAVRRLAGSSSFVLHHRDDGSVGTILIVARSGETPRPVPVSPGVPDTAPEPSARELRSIALRDVVELSYREDAEARRALLRLAAEAEDAAIRRAAIGALGGVDDLAARAAIGGSGLTDRDPSVRRQAAHSLWRQLGRSAQPRLAAAAAVEADPEVRAAILAILSAPR